MDWIRGEKLGNGCFGTVSLAESRGHSSSLPPLMAVKSCGVLQSSSLMNEISVLQELQGCQEVVRCFGGSVTYEHGERLYNMLLEYAPGGSLADRVRNSADGRLPESDIRRYSKALLKGLHYIHKFGYVHCDIKLQNILLGPDGAVRIADFGLATRVGYSGGMRGTPMYMSPEVVAGGEQGAPADIWALGCAVSEMASGSLAWSSSDLAGLLMRIGAGEELPGIPGILPDDGQDFLEKCFVKDPRERWTAEMLLRHPFICGQEMDGDRVAASNDATSVSPRCPFDFPDWTTIATNSITSLPSPESASWFADEHNFGKGSLAVSPAKRLRELVGTQSPDWSVREDWVTVR